MASCNNSDMSGGMYITTEFYNTLQNIKEEPKDVLENFKKKCDETIALKDLEKNPSSSHAPDVLTDICPHEVQGTLKQEYQISKSTLNSDPEDLSLDSPLRNHDKVDCIKRSIDDSDSDSIEILKEMQKKKRRKGKKTPISSHDKNTIDLECLLNSLPDESGFLIKLRTINYDNFTCPKCNKHFREINDASKHYYSCRSSIKKERQLALDEIEFICTTCHFHFCRYSALFHHKISCSNGNANISKCVSHSENSKNYICGKGYSGLNLHDIPTATISGATSSSHAMNYCNFNTPSVSKTEVSTDLSDLPSSSSFCSPLLQNNATDIAFQSVHSKQMSSNSNEATSVPSGCLSPHSGSVKKSNDDLYKYMYFLGTPQGDANNDDFHEHLCALLAASPIPKKINFEELFKMILKYQTNRHVYLGLHLHVFVRVRLQCFVDSAPYNVYALADSSTCFCASCLEEFPISTKIIEHLVTVHKEKEIVIVIL